MVTSKLEISDFCMILMGCTLENGRIFFFKAAVDNFAVVFYLEKSHNTHRQLLVSDMVWEYHKISVFSHHASVFRIGEYPIASILFVQSATLSVLSVLIGRSTLRFLATGDVDTSWSAFHALRSDSPLLTVCLQATPLAGSSSSWDREVYSAAAFPVSVWSWFKVDFKERVTTTRAREKMGRGGCSKTACKRVSTANVSLLAKTYQLQL